MSGIDFSSFMPGLSSELKGTSNTGGIDAGLFSSHLDKASKSQDSLSINFRLMSLSQKLSKNPNAPAPNLNELASKMAELKALFPESAKTDALDFKSLGLNLSKSAEDMIQLSNIFAVLFQDITKQKNTSGNSKRVTELLEEIHVALDSLEKGIPKGNFFGNSSILEDAGLSPDQVALYNQSPHLFVEQMRKDFLSSLMDIGNDDDDDDDDDGGSDNFMSGLSQTNTQLNAAIEKMGKKPSDAAAFQSSVGF